MKLDKSIEKQIKLTEKQKRFADECIISGNATQSAIKAGYSSKYANTNASKLLQNTTMFTDKTEVAVSEIPIFVDDIDGDTDDG